MIVDLTCDISQELARERPLINNMDACQHVRNAIFQMAEPTMKKGHSKVSFNTQTTDMHSENDMKPFGAALRQETNSEGEGLSYNQAQFSTAQSGVGTRIRSSSFENSSLIKRKRKKSLLLQDLKEEEIEEICNHANNPTKENKKNLNVIDELFEEENILTDTEAHLCAQQRRNIPVFTSSKESALSFEFKETNSENEDGSSLGKRMRVAINPAELAELHGGKMLKIKKTKEGIKMSFTCKMNHRFSLMSYEENSWCKVCDSLLKNAKRHACEKGGVLLSQKLTAELRFRCKAGHEWEVSYKKCMRNWCKDCKKQRKKMVKEILEEEQRRVENDRKNKQDKMLEEARVDMLKNTQKSQTQKEEQLKRFRVLEQEITRLATKYS